MIVELKTKKPIMINIRTMQPEIVYMRINNVNFDEIGLNVNFSYLTKREEIDSDGNSIFYDNSILKDDVNNFTTQEANQLEISLGIDKENFTSTFTELIAKSALYFLGQRKIFGLTSDDWEIVE